MTTHSLEQTELDRLCNEVLTAIELNEAMLLHWGFICVQSKLSEELPSMLNDLHDHAYPLWETAKQAGVTPDDIVANLRERKLILTNKDNELFRSRFAETVRLLYLLRQRLSPKDWKTASRLVSDMRIQLQRRRYPKRDISQDDLLKKVESLGLGSLHKQTIQQLLQLPDGTRLTLARFQADAIVQQFRNLREYNNRALVIGAGTGAGKTKAFYIPALAEIATMMTDECTTKALAIYPRIELLKDQLAEAYAEANKLDTILQSANKRPITLGAYYGDTPRSANDLLKHPEWNPSWKQTESRDGWICPYMPCPKPACGKDLVWLEVDVKKEASNTTRKHNPVYGTYARLRCPTCGTEVTSNHLLLTREQMVGHPPDILFTTTEMLNRRLSDANEHALFGIGTAKPPRLVLLDEIHTYEGMTGAQVAYLLRRWQHARGFFSYQNLCIVGLSATLSEAQPFFSKLTGIPLHQVEYICPSDEDMVEEGIEYNLVLKGDPVSGTSLLSTSVQTAMLLGRILDPIPLPAHESVSRGVYGQKIFAFTDKLDVINRWYHIEYDAETKKRLSQHRQKNTKLSKTDQALQNDMGQRWMICEDIGHNLRTPLILDLTSSQYRGVDTNANLVIATSTLEVGFNDPTVGAIIQHKSPRSLASFLQRKGRAGRTRTMRPWMAVVTSAYGRDRWAFQHAETLFNPTLRSIELPMENTYVRKIQATFALMDWLTITLKKQGTKANVWELLRSDSRRRNSYLQSQRQKVQSIVEAVLQGGESLDSLSKYLQGALGLQQDEQSLNAILWGEPRPILLDVLPTLLRQLERDWGRVNVQQGEVEEWSDNISATPLPGFVPSNLFSVLHLPELRVHIPDTKSSRQREDEYLPLAQGMVEFAPGHVSKRYAHRDNEKEAHWLQLPDETMLSDGTVSLNHLNMVLDEVPDYIAIANTTYLVYRPLAYTLSMVPTNVKSTSTGYLEWRSHFSSQYHHDFPSEARETDETQHGDEEHDTLASHLMLASDSKWHNFFPHIKAYIQANGSWVEVTRLAIGVQLDTRYDKGDSVRRTLFFQEEDTQPSALGFHAYVDALSFVFQPLDTQALLLHSQWQALYQHLGPEYFRYRLQHDECLTEKEHLSTFEIDWLWQLMLSMLVATAIAKQCSLPESAEEVKRNPLKLADRTLHVIFQSQKPEVDDEDDAGRLHKTLMEHLRNPTILNVLFEHATVLWNAPDSDLEAWMQMCYASSLGTVLFSSVTQLVPDIDPDELALDIDSDSNTIWISEITAGGIGVITKIADAIAQHPHAFDLQMRDTIENCDREQLAIQLRSVATLVDQSYDTLSSLFTQMRNTTDLPSLNATRKLLAQTLEEHGIPANRELIVALNTKFLRPNSGKDTDELIALLVRHWIQEEQRLGCMVDLRVMAVAARQIPEIEAKVLDVLQRIGGNNTTTADESQIFNLFQSLLWLDCRDSCPDCIEQYFPYQKHERPSRALLHMLLNLQLQSIAYGLPDWTAQVNHALSTRYHCQITCEQSELHVCKDSLLAMLTQPIEVGYQFFYPVIERIARQGRAWFIEIIIRDLIRR